MTQAPSVATGLSIDGMTCAACVSRVEKVLRRVPGVQEARVDLMTRQAHIQAGPEVRAEALMAAVERAGYHASPIGRPEVAERLWPVLLALGLAAPIMLPMLLAPLGVPMLPGWAQAALASPVQLWFGTRFAVAGFKSIRAFSPSMDALVAIGTWSAYLLSLVRVLRDPQGMDALYFDGAAVVVALVLLGRHLEGRARLQAGAALAALHALVPQIVLRRSDGVDREVALAALAVGDLVAVRAGSRIPVDGVVVQGRSDLDQQALTGESLPVPVAEGDAVTAGGINLSGLLVLRAERLGSETMLGRMLAMVADAQAQKPALQRLADRVSAWFVPAVLLLALVSFAGWMLIGAGPAQALVVAVSVLVIACPCALGLATPAAIMVGTGMAARFGIVLRDTAVLDRASRIRTVVFDKTGTLTEGRPELILCQPADGGEEKVLLGWATALQATSTHPLARAVRARGAPAAPATELVEHPGEGVCGVVAGRQLGLGHAAMLARAGLGPADLPQAIAASVQALQARGATLSYLVEISPRPCVLGLLGFADTIRPTSINAVDSLHALGLRAVLLSGDSAASVGFFAKTLGLDDAVGGLSPADKLARIRALQADGPVCMVGDGINDAPALAAADLGIAMASGTDIAMKSASIVLMRSDPAMVAAALDIAARTQTRIRAGLAWAFVFNAIGLPLAAMGLLNPAVAGAAMAFSSLAVVLNALWLRRWRPFGAGASRPAPGGARYRP